VGGSVLEGAFRSTDFEETRAWPERPEWATEESDRNTFAIVYHNVAVMRKKYPYLVLYVSRASSRSTSPESVPLSDHVFSKFPNVKVNRNLAVGVDGDFHPAEFVEVLLFDSELADFSDFAGGLFNPKYSYHVSVLLSRDHQDLTMIKGLIEGVQNPDALRGQLLRHFEVLFDVDPEWSFTMATGDSELVGAFIRHPECSRL
jgi:hypothetical protein